METDLSPSFLVAMDPIVDPNFRRAVVLVLEHDHEGGALGLILNRSTDYPAAELCENLDLAWRGAPGACVGWGGPVGQETGWVLMGDAAAAGTDALLVAPGLYWSRSLESLRRVADEPTLPSRLYLGYAGWGSGQLEHEIADGAWLVVPPHESLVFGSDHDAMWGDAVRILGIEPATLVSSQGVN